MPHMIMIIFLTVTRASWKKPGNTWQPILRLSSPSSCSSPAECSMSSRLVVVMVISMDHFVVILIDHVVVILMEHFVMILMDHIVLWWCFYDKDGKLVGSLWRLRSIMTIIITIIFTVDYDDRDNFYDLDYSDNNFIYEIQGDQHLLLDNTLYNDDHDDL